MMLLVVVFVSGMTTMAVEMAASRLLGPYFGDSILVWANLIGLILIYLTLGAYLGGRWADRSPRVETLYTITTAAAFLTGLVPFVAAPILRLSQGAFGSAGAALAGSDAIQIGGSFVGILILFAPPVILLGCVSPFAIRLATKQIRSAGSSAGRIYALSTMGSILGTFAPVLILIPAIGTAKTFLLFAFLLLAISLGGLIARRTKRRALLSGLLLAVLILLSAVFPQRVVKADARMIYERESRYNYIQVLEVEGVRYLMLNEGQGVHSVYDPHSLTTFGTWDAFVIAPFFNDPPFSPRQVRRICIIGLAGGTVARQATAVYGPVPIDGVEIDPAIVEVGRRFFGMTQPNLNVYVADGRFFLERSAEQYDLIVIDAYRLPYIPFQLTTTEFFGLVKAHLTPRGVVTVNVGRTESDYRMVEAIAATLQAHFATVHAIDITDTFNTVLVATQEPTRGANLEANLRASAEMAGHPFLRDTLARSIANLRPLRGEGMVFTDDRAPVESLTNAIVLRYMLTGR
jgi:spermidine synthase